MTWLTENPLPILVIGSVGFVLLLVGYVASRSARFLLAAGGVVVLVVGLVVAERLIVTEAEEVETAVWTLAAAVEQNDLEAVLESISPAAEHLRRAVRAALPQVQVTSINVSGLESEVPGKRIPRIGTATFRAKVEFSAPEFPYQVSFDKWELTFRLEEEKWLLFDAVRSSAIGPPRVLPLVPSRN